MIGIQHYQNWMKNEVWPLWLAKGVDWDKKAFFEYLDPVTLTCNENFRRLRVAARQIISFSKAHELEVPRSEEAVFIGLDFLENVAELKNGGYARTFDLDNKPIDTSLDLYDLAFVLLAFSAASKVAGTEVMHTKSKQLLTFLIENFKHTSVGYIEGIPLSIPRRQNPHMHLFEALLESYEAFKDPIYLQLAYEILDLFLGKFLSVNKNCIAEFFDDELIVKKNNGNFIVEPGHTFEWIWLLNKFEKITAKGIKLDDTTMTPYGSELNQTLRPIYLALFEFVDIHAVNSYTGLVYDELKNSGQVSSFSSRIWPQTERIRAELLCRSNDDKKFQALNSFQIFTNELPKGLWHEQVDNNGKLIYPVARASTLYHLTTSFFSKL